MSYATLRYDVSDTGVGTIALDQPDTRNALSDELLGDLVAALETARDDQVARERDPERAGEHVAVGCAD